MALEEAMGTPERAVNGAKTDKRARVARIGGGENRMGATYLPHGRG